MELDERERLIVFLRYYKDQTQSEVAATSRDFASTGFKVRKENSTTNERPHESMIHVVFHLLLLIIGYPILLHVH